MACVSAQPMYLAVMCAILSVKRRSYEKQAVKLREALNEKNRRGFPTEASHLVSVALLPLFPFSTLKLLAFEHGQDRYKLRRATLDWPSRDIYIYEFSL